MIQKHRKLLRQTLGKNPLEPAKYVLIKNKKIIGEKIKELDSLDPFDACIEALCHLGYKIEEIER